MSSGHLGRAEAGRTPTKASALRRVAQVVAYEALSGSTRQIHSPDWLTAVLARGVPGAQVMDVRRVGGSTGTTLRVALALEWNGAGGAAQLPERVFVKATASLAQRLMLGLGGLIHGEPAFYAHVRPRLAIEAPTGYFGAVEGRSWRAVVVLEDVVATRGARFWSPATTITRPQVEDLLGNLAIWHGALWDSPLLRAWTWLRTPADQMRLIDALIGLADRRSAGVRRAQKVTAPALRPRQGDLFEGMRRSMEILSAAPRTYLHGDLHAANTYATGTGAMGVADWQVGLQGCWAYDLAYLLATAPDIEQRRAWERDLLAFYLERLREAGGGHVSLERAWTLYRQATFYPYFAWIYTLGRSRLQPRFQPDAVSLRMVERISAAVDDLGSLHAVGL